MTSNNNTLLNQTCRLVGALELHMFVDVDFKRSRFTMKSNESESEVVYSDPAIDMSQSNHFRRREKGEGGRGGGVRLSKHPRGDTNRRLKPTQAILTKTIHKTRRQAGGFSTTEGVVTGWNHPNSVRGVHKPPGFCIAGRFPVPTLRGYISWQSSSNSLCLCLYAP